jgi:Uma2 family endonuclease
MTTTQLLTATEFFDWCHRPENRDQHYELEKGLVVEVSRPGERHGVTCANVTRVMGNFAFERKRGYVVANDTGVIWELDPDTVRGPDVMYYAVSRRFTDMNPKYSEEPPDVAVEVLSPTDRISKVTRRAGEFLRWGTRLVWVLDPEDQTLTIYRPDRSPEVLDAAQELVGEGPLEGFRCRVADFFYSPEDETKTATS